MHVPHIPTCVKVTQVLAFYPQNTRICRNSTHWVSLTRPHNHSYLHSRKHGPARLVHVSFLLVIFLNCWRILNYFFVFCIVCWLFCCLPCISLKLETLEFAHLLGLKGPPKKKEEIHSYNLRGRLRLRLWCRPLQERRQWQPRIWQLDRV